MKTTLLFVVLFTLLNSVSAQVWYRRGGNGGDNSGEDVATDAAGNVYATGYYGGVINLATTTLVSTDATDIFLVKYDNNGNFKWARSAGGYADDIGYGLYAEPSGNTYITGKLALTGKFDSISLTAHNSDMFLAKYDANGACQWAHNFGGSSSDCGYSICSDGSNNMYVTGYFSGTATFGTTTLTSAGAKDIFIAKFDSSGNCLWAQKAGGIGDDAGRAIFYSAGNLYVTGWFNLSITVGSTTLTSSGSDDVFIAKYDLSGNPVWATKGGGVTKDEGTAITADASGNCYVSGYFSNNAVFGTTTYTSNDEDQFTARYDASGNFVSLSHYHGSFNIGDVIVDAAGTVYEASGRYSPPVGSSGTATGLCFDNAGNIFSTGNFTSNSALNSNIFVAKFATPTAVNPLALGSPITIFPNPTSSTLFVQGLHLNESITIRDVTGRIVLQKNASGTNEEVNIATLRPGMYLLQTEAGQAKIVKD